MEPAETGNGNMALVGYRLSKQTERLYGSEALMRMECVGSESGWLVRECRYERELRATDATDATDVSGDSLQAALLTAQLRPHCAHNTQHGSVRATH